MLARWLLFCSVSVDPNTALIKKDIPVLKDSEDALNQ